MKHYRKGILIGLLMLSCSMIYGSVLADKTVAWMQMKEIDPVVIVVLISMLPLIELRGAIPIGILLFKLPWIEVVVLSILGNMIPIPLILLFVEWFFSILSKNPIGHKFTQWLFQRTRKKGKVIENYKALGLAIFVGIPLPGTGAWTGAFAGKIFGIGFWKSMLYIFIGVLIAALIMTFLSLAGGYALA